MFALFLFSYFPFSTRKKTTNSIAVVVVAVCAHKHCRYEQGLEDYEEAVARVDKMQEDQQTYAMGGLQTVLTLIETAGNVWNKVSHEFEQKQSTIADKSNDRPTVNDESDSNDQNGKSRQINSKVSKKRGEQSDWQSQSVLIALCVLFSLRFIAGQ